MWYTSDMDAIDPAELKAARSLVARALSARRRREHFACVICGNAFEAVYRKPPSTPRYCSNACKVKAWQARQKGQPS